MDAAMVADIRARIEFERGRTSTPEGFPELPDIPLARYTDETFFQAEIDQVFRRTWQFAGHESEWEGPGSYRVLDIPFAPVVVARGTDGRLRAFLNACRHRGAPVVREQSGKAKHLVCQYHAWVYNLEGALIGVPDERDFNNLRMEERGLKSVRCETWNGFVFVNLDPLAVPLLEWLAPVDRRYSDLMGARYRFIEKKTFHVACNWKLLPEAFAEAYHVDTIHVKTASPYFDNRGQVQMLLANGHGSAVAPFARLSPEASAELEAGFFPASIPRVADIPGIYYDSSVSFSLFPNVHCSIDANGFPLLRFTPLSVDASRLDILFYGLDWGSGPVPAGWRSKMDAWYHLVGEEDLKNLEPMQKSLEAAAHGGIPLSYQERRLWQLHADLDRWIGAGNIPDSMRVPYLLGDYVEA